VPNLTEREKKVSTEKRFCTSCGKPLEPGDKFCGSCGYQLTKPATNAAPPPTPAASANVPPPAAAVAPPPVIAAPPPATPSPAAQERLTGIIPAVSRKKGLFSVEGFNVIVTEKRIIFAAMTNEMVKAEAAKQGQKGFFAGMLGAATVGYTFYKRYLDMAPEAALRENPQNFAIELGRIRKIKLEMGSHIRDKSRNIDRYEQSKLEIETTGDKYRFDVPHDFHGTAQDVIRKSGLM
jgi:hypothetical protein